MYSDQIFRAVIKKLRRTIPNSVPIKSVLLPNQKKPFVYLHSIALKSDQEKQSTGVFDGQIRIVILNEEKDITTVNKLSLQVFEGLNREAESLNTLLTTIRLNFCLLSSETLSSRVDGKNSTIINEMTFDYQFVIL